MDRPGRGLAGSGDRWSGSWDRSCWRNEVQARVSLDTHCERIHGYLYGRAGRGDG